MPQENSGVWGGAPARRGKRSVYEVSAKFRTKPEFNLCSLFVLVFHAVHDIGQCVVHAEEDHDRFAPEPQKDDSEQRYENACHRAAYEGAHNRQPARTEAGYGDEDHRHESRDNAKGSA